MLNLKNFLFIVFTFLIQVIWCNEISYTQSEINEDTFLCQLNNANNESERALLQMKLGAFYYYFNNDHLNARDFFEKGIFSSAENNKVNFIALFTLGKIYFENKCPLLPEDIERFKTTKNKSKYCFEMVVEFHNHFKIKNYVAYDYARFNNLEYIADNDNEIPEQNARATFFLVKIYYDELQELQQNKNVSLQEINQRQLLLCKTIDKVIKNSLTTKDEYNFCQKLQKKLPKFPKG